MVLLRDSWWIVLLAPAFAFVSTQIAFFSHDAAHHQIAQGGQVSALLALVHGNLLIGMSYGWRVAYTEANLVESYAMGLRHLRDVGSPLHHVSSG
jgi:hypothetical protein